jgi:acetyl-CoA acetyltransferase
VTGLAAIAGVYEGPLDNQGRPCVQIAALCAAGAVRDAGLEMTEVDGVLAALPFEEPSMMFAAEVADALGLEPAYAETVCFGGASPAMMVPRAVRAINAGLCEVLVLTSASNRASKLGRAGSIAALRDVLSAEFEVPYGAFIPPVYALTARRCMHELGITERQMAAVAATQRGHAAAHPGAAMREPLEIDEVLSSPMIATPLRKLDCCLVTDFGGSIVVTSATRAGCGGQRPAWILGVGEAHDRLSTSNVRDLTRRGSAKSGAAAFAEAGIRPCEVDLACLYDSFTITVLLTLENLGLCARGKAGAAMERGEFSASGRLPINTNGGMLSYRTGGISHIVEAVEQIRGSARGMQVSDVETAVVHGIGGAMSSHCTLVLGKEAAS